MNKLVAFLTFFVLFFLSSCLMPELKEVERRELHILLSNDLYSDTVYLKTLGKKAKLKLYFYHEDSIKKNDKTPYDLLLSNNIYQSCQHIGGMFLQIDRKLLKSVDQKFYAADRTWMGLHYNPHLIMISKTISEDSLITITNLSASEWQNAIQFPSSKNSFSNSMMFQLSLKLGGNNTSSLFKQLSKGDTLRFYDSIVHAKNLLRVNRFTGIYTTQKEYLLAKKDSGFANYKAYFLWQNQGGTPYDLSGLAQLRNGINKKNQVKFISFINKEKIAEELASHHYALPCSKAVKKLPSYGLYKIASIELIPHASWKEQYLKSKLYTKKKTWKSRYYSEKKEVN
jgi:hypothetical protein